MNRSTSLIALVAASLMPLAAQAFTTTFEDGLSYGLGNGPAPVQPYGVDGFAVSFANASYSDCCFTSGTVGIVQYVIDSHDGQFWGYHPITATFSADASSVSVMALIPQSFITGTLTAYDQFGQVVGSDSASGIPHVPSSDPAYAVQLSVTAGNIRSIKLDGQYWANGATGWQAAFDDLTVTPVPEPKPLYMLLAGIGIIAAYSKKRGKH